ncbi:MAG: hypothetical protein E7581_02210 [Ruminococcaceae bacterium]|nr:hypothetical protein [Oscillospiraceae bacterium]
MLPELEKNKTHRQIDDDFSKGLWHRAGKKQGSYFAGENVCGYEYPALISRPPRRVWQLLSEGVQGMCCADGLYFVCDGELLRAKGYNQTEALGRLSQSTKVFGALGSELLILPDFKALDQKSMQLRSLGASLLLGNAMVQNQSFVDEEGKAQSIEFNTLHCIDFNFLDFFSPGDSVCIKGSDYNDGYYTVRAVEEHDLRFDEHAFVPESMMNCIISKSAPAMQGMCACGDRLWGYAGDTIYACAPGLVDNWFRYDGDAQSSYCKSLPSGGDFTACIMHAGHPVFFKSNSMLEVYGDQPDNVSVVETVLSGVAAGSAASLCSVGGDMLYLSENGVVRCSGSTASVISEALGKHLSNGVAASDGRRYYLSAVDGSGMRALYVYDTVTNAWHTEDGANILHLAYLNGDVYAYCADHIVYILGQDRTGHGRAQGESSSYVEFHPLTDDARGQIVPVRLGVRVYCAQGCSLTLFVSYDGKDWERRAELQSTGSQLWYVPLQPRACHSLGIRLDGTGDYRILSLIKEYQ